MCTDWIHFLLLSHILITSNAQPTNNNNLKDFLTKTIEMVRPEMKKGSTETGIDVMDPLDVPDYQYVQPGDLVSVRAYFKHIQIPNLSTFKLDDVIVNKTSHAFLKFSFPSITAVGDYIFETSTFGIPVANANGKFQVTATDVKSVGLVKLTKDSNGVYQCQEVQMKTSEGNVEMNMEGLAGDDFLRNILDPREVYNEYKPRINKKITDAIKKMLNYAFKNFTQ